MKKYILSLSLIIIFAFYAMLSNQNSLAVIGTTPDNTIADNNQKSSSSNGTASAATVTDNVPSNVPVKPVPTPTATPKPVTTALYKDGSYSGNSADAYYGSVQVVAIVQGGKLTDVQVPVYPADRGTSVRINSRAIPQLVREAISAQSAKVDAVSGATETSQGFQTSLASALIQAKN